MQLNQLTFEKASLLQMAGLLTGTAVAAAVWECLCVLPSNLVHWQWISPPTLHLQRPWLLSFCPAAEDAAWSCSFPFQKFVDAGNTHPSPHQMPIHDVQDRWKGVIACRMINRNEVVLCWDWFVMYVYMFRHLEWSICKRNCSTNSHSGSSSVVTIHIDLETVLLKYSIKNTETSVFLSY